MGNISLFRENQNPPFIFNNFFSSKYLAVLR